MVVVHGGITHFLVVHGGENVITPSFNVLSDHADYYRY